MNGPIEIKGGAGAFEAAIIAVVLDHVNAEEKARESRLNPEGNRLPAWIRAINPGLYPDRFEQRLPG